MDMIDQIGGWRSVGGMELGMGTGTRKCRLVDG